MGVLDKIKKTIKKVAKPAAGIGAVLLAANAMKNRKNLAGTEDGKGGIDTTRRALQAMTSNDAYNDDTMPMNLSKTAGKTGSRKIPQIAYGQQMYKSGGRAGKKSKPKSMGKALRGGGKVMR